MAPGLVSATDVADSVLRNGGTVRRFRQGLKWAAVLLAGAIVGGAAVGWFKGRLDRDAVVVVRNADDVPISKGSVEFCDRTYTFGPLTPGRYVVIPQKVRCNNEYTARVEFESGERASRSGGYVAYGVPQQVTAFVARDRSLAVVDPDLERVSRTPRALRDG